jgi:hypothetical protein
MKKIRTSKLCVCLGLGVKFYPTNLLALRKSFSRTEMVVLSKKLIDRGKVIDKGNGENGK